MSQEIDQYTKNSQYAAEVLFQETGKRVGKPTGYCHRFFMGTLTGEVIPEVFTYYDQLKIERQKGIFCIPMDYGINISREGLIAIGLTQEIIPNVGIRLNGKHKGSYQKHVACILPDKNASKINIFDSLIENGYQSVDTIPDVNMWIERNFEAYDLEIFLILTDTNPEIPYFDENLSYPGTYGYNLGSGVVCWLPVELPHMFNPH